MNTARKAPAKAKASQTGGGSLIAHLQDVVQEIVARFGGLTRRKMLVSDGWFVADKAFALVSRQGLPAGRTAHARRGRAPRIGACLTLTGHLDWSL